MGGSSYGFGCCDNVWGRRDGALVFGAVAFGLAAAPVTSDGVPPIDGVEGTSGRASRAGAKSAGSTGSPTTTGAGGGTASTGIDVDPSAGPSTEAAGVASVGAGAFGSSSDVPTMTARAVPSTTHTPTMATDTRAAVLGFSVNETSLRESESGRGPARSFGVYTW